MEYAFLCYQGIKDRNEDAILIGNEVLRDTEGTGREKIKLIAVADGVSGNIGGDVASKLVLDAIASSSVSKIEDIELSLGKARTLMQNLVLKQESFKDMSTTLSLVLIDEDITVFNLGDSPIFITKFDNLRKVSHEDSLYHDMLESKLITEDDTSINRHVITKYVHPYNVFKPNIKQVVLNDGDYILITSDGITDVCSNELIQNVILASSMTLEEKVKGLYEIALARGSSDNISVILLKI